MKYVIVVLAALAIFSTPSEALFSSVVNSISNVVNTVSNTVNTAVVAGQFLWDNALSPSLQVLQNNGANFIDNYFGNLLNAIGKRSVDRLQVEAQKSFMLELFQSQTTALIAGLKGIFLRFFEELKTTVQSSLVSIALGQTSVKQIIQDLINKAKQEVLALVQQTVHNITNPVGRANGLDGFAVQLSDYVSQIGNLVTSVFNQILSNLNLQTLLG